MESLRYLINPKKLGKVWLINSMTMTRSHVSQHFENSKIKSIEKKMRKIRLACVSLRWEIQDFKCEAVQYTKVAGIAQKLTPDTNIGCDVVSLKLVRARSHLKKAKHLASVILFIFIMIRPRIKIREKRKTLNTG
jgi:hypothetical protein